MIEKLVIPCEDGDIILDVDYDVPGHRVDFDELDHDLILIDNGKLDVALPEDTYNYNNHQWETQKGKLIGNLFERVDAGEQF
jgi:hypothetical protein